LRNVLHNNFCGIIVFLISKLVPHALHFFLPLAEKIDSILNIAYVTKETLAITVLASIMGVFWGMAFKVKQGNE